MVLANIRWHQVVASWPALEDQDIVSGHMHSSLHQWYIRPIPDGGRCTNSYSAVSNIKSTDHTSATLCATTSATCDLTHHTRLGTVCQYIEFVQYNILQEAFLQYCMAYKHTQTNWPYQILFPWYKRPGAQSHSCEELVMPSLGHCWQQPAITSRNQTHTAYNPNTFQLAFTKHWKKRSLDIFAVCHIGPVLI